MIKVHRLNGKEFILNSDLIKYVESTPDTVVTLSTGEKIMVKESIGEVIDQTVAFRQLIHQSPQVLHDKERG